MALIACVRPKFDDQELVLKCLLSLLMSVLLFLCFYLKISLFPFLILLMNIVDTPRSIDCNDSPLLVAESHLQNLFNIKNLLGLSFV